MWKSRKSILLFLALLFCSLAAYASTSDTTLEKSLTALQYPRNSSISKQEWTNLKQTTINLYQITQTLKQNFQTLTASPVNSAESSTPLQNLLDEGSNLFDQLDNQLQTLSQQLANSETTITALQNTLEQAKQTIKNLQESLTRANAWANQMGERLQDNNEDLARAYEELDAADAYVIRLQKKANRAGSISLSFGLVGGASLAWGVTDAIYSRDPMRAVYGFGGGLISFGVWALGHWAFDWW